MNIKERDPGVVATLLRARLATGPIELAVTGPSMGTTIRSGETVCLHAADQARRGEVWALVDDTGRVVVHRIREISETTIVARGSGNNLDDDPLPVERLVGRVVTSTGDQGKTSEFGEFNRISAALRFRLRRALRGLRL